MTVLYSHAIIAVDGEESTEENPVVVKEYLIAISDDLVHDNHFVHKTRSMISEYLSSISANVQVMHEFTDGCSVQYKSRHCMADVSNSECDFGYKTIRNFFETSHAKGEQDAAGGHCKTKADHAIVREGKQFKHANDFFQYLDSEFRQPSTEGSDLKRRVFFEVQDVNRRRPMVPQPVKEGGGIRSWHSVCSTGLPGCIGVRKRSCYCQSCLYGEWQYCEQKEYVDQFEMIRLNIQTAKTPTTRQQVEEEEPIVEDATQLVEKGSNIIIAADGDVRNDFYILSVTSNGEEFLLQDECDDYGMDFTRGSKVFRGHFFELTNSNDMEYTLNLKTAIVHTQTMRCVAPEFNMKMLSRGKRKFKLTPLQHQDIMSAIY